MAMDLAPGLRKGQSWYAIKIVEHALVKLRGFYLKVYNSVFYATARKKDTSITLYKPMCF